MKLSNTTIQFTITIPSIEINKDYGIFHVRDILKKEAFKRLEHIHDKFYHEGQITDCPDYPLLCD